MTLDIQFKLKNNPNYLHYLRENSYWYKILNRSPEKFKEFEEDFKYNNRLRITNKISETFKTIEILQNVLSTLK